MTDGRKGGNSYVRATHCQNCYVHGFPWELFGNLGGFFVVFCFVTTIGDATGISGHQLETSATCRTVPHHDELSYTLVNFNMSGRTIKNTTKLQNNHCSEPPKI